MHRHKWVDGWFNDDLFHHNSFHILFYMNDLIIFCSIRMIQSFWSSCEFLGKLIIKCAVGWMQILRALYMTSNHWILYLEEARKWKGLALRGEQREQDGKAQAGVVLVNVIKTVSPWGTSRDVCVLMSLALTWGSIVFYFLYIFFVSFHLLHHHTSTSLKVSLPSVTLFSMTVDRSLSLSSCLLISLTCTLIFLLPLLMCQQTWTRQDAVKSAVIRRERQRKRGIKWGMGGGEQIWGENDGPLCNRVCVCFCKKAWGSMWHYPA